MAVGIRARCTPALSLTLEGDWGAHDVDSVERFTFQNPDLITDLAFSRTEPEVGIEVKFRVQR